MSNTRDLGIADAGKGDAERSPGWRNNYDDIDWGRWHEGAPASLERIRIGFKRCGSKFIKTYGNKS